MHNETHRAEIGKRIKRLRQAQDITVNELAKRSTISAGYLSEIERGMSAVSIDKVKQVAQGLGVGVDALLGDAPLESSEQMVQIPSALSSAAEQLNLSYRATLALFQGQKSLQARRSNGVHGEWDIDQWVKFYQQVKDYLPEC